MWREASLVWRANGTEHRKLKLGEKLENDVWCLRACMPGMGSKDTVRSLLSKDGNAEKSVEFVAQQFTVVLGL